MARFFGRGRGLEYLSHQQVLDWHQHALQLLSTVGAKVTWEPALKLLADAGCEVNKASGLVRMPAHLVEQAIRQSPGRFRLGGRDPATDVIVGGVEVHTTGSGNCVNVIDLESGEHRPGTFRDLQDMVRLQDALDNLETQNPIAPGPAALPYVKAPRARA
jgi:trimethylamine--corrinoid protein Co-methyltransferase